MEYHLRLRLASLSSGPCDHLFVVSTSCTRHFTWASREAGEPPCNAQGSCSSCGLLQRLFLPGWCACPPVPTLTCPLPSPGTGLIHTLMVPGTQASGNISVNPGGVQNLGLQWLLISFLFLGPAQPLWAHASCSGCQTPGGCAGLSRAVMAAGGGATSGCAFGTKGSRSEGTTWIEKSVHSKGCGWWSHGTV